MQTQMEKEANQAPKAVADAIEKNAELFKKIAQTLQKETLNFAMTIARGSSDHAALFAKYLLEIKLQLITATFSPSVETLYKANPNKQNSLTIAISQSGRSPDLCEAMLSAKKAGSKTIAFVNHADSPLAEHSEFVVPLQAGEEKAVAATKSYIASLSNLIHFVATVKNDNDLLCALKSLPKTLEKALHADWSKAIDILTNTDDLLIVGRGYSFPIAMEAALKCKETAVIHAEAFSSAEILHGPFALIRKNYPVLIFCQNDETLAGTLALAEKCAALGAIPLLAAPENLQPQISSAVIHLPLPASNHPICDPLVAIQAFYKMIAVVAQKRGHNPDNPEHLSKVTETR